MRISRKVKVYGSAAALVLGLGGGALALSGGTALAACTPSATQACVSVTVGTSASLYVGYSAISFPALSPSGNDFANAYQTPYPSWITGALNNNNAGSYSETEEVFDNSATGYEVSLEPASGATAFTQTGDSYTIPNSSLTDTVSASSVAAGGDITEGQNASYNGNAPSGSNWTVGAGVNLYTTPNPSQPTGDVFNDTWILNANGLTIPSGAFSETWEYVLQS